MCTVTLSYDQNNALARRKLSTLLGTGLFVEKQSRKARQSREQAEHRSEVDAFMAASKRSMSSVVARYLWNTDRDIVRRLGAIRVKYFNEIVDKVIGSIFWGRLAQARTKTKTKTKTHPHGRKAVGMLLCVTKKNGGGSKKSQKSGKILVYSSRNAYLCKK